MISRCVESLKVPPDWMGSSVFELQHLSVKFVVNRVVSNLCGDQIFRDKIIKATAQ
jgi:hypothetical protein